MTPGCAGSGFMAPVTNIAEHTHNSSMGLVITIGIITVGLIGIIIFSSYIDRKMSAMAYSLKESEERFLRLDEIKQEIYERIEKAAQILLIQVNDNNITKPAKVDQIPLMVATQYEN